MATVGSEWKVRHAQGFREADTWIALIVGGLLVLIVALAYIHLTDGPTGGDGAREQVQEPELRADE